MTTFKVGELIDFQWKLGVSMKSNNCNTLNHPFISILIEVAEANSKQTTHTFELSLAQFQDFAQNFKDLSELMETLAE